MTTIERPAVIEPCAIASFGTIARDEIVDRVVSELSAICKRATLDFAVSVGKVVVEAFYAGDLTLWRKRGAKMSSFRKLARHPLLPMSPASLYRSVAIYELCERLGPRVWKHVAATHMRLVLPVPADQQTFWLEAAETGAWPARRLEAEIDARQPRVSFRGGRKRGHPLKKTIRTLEKCLDDQHGLVGADEYQMKPSPASARCMLQTLHQIRTACASLESRIVQHAWAEPGQTATEGAAPDHRRVKRVY